MGSIHHSSPIRRRNRPKVPADKRQRVAKACTACRRVKEKCHGGQPCSRCLRIGRECEIIDVNPVSSKLLSTCVSDPSYFDADRIALLEQIVSCCTGVTDLGKEQLLDLAHALHNQHTRTEEPLNRIAEVHSEQPCSRVDYIDVDSSPGATYAGELSNSTFSKRVQGVVSPAVKKDGPPSSHPAASPSLPQSLPLHSEARAVNDAAASLPPEGVADFLLDIFFSIGQTNYSYVDEKTLREQLNTFHSKSAVLTVKDAAWLCVALAIFAVGTQFAHLSDPVSTTNTDSGHREYSTDDAVALTFYRAATQLVPDCLAVCSIESVQAFILLGIYTLPVDAAGLSCTYFGIAIKIAIHNGMHRRLPESLDPRQNELRRRIWWTTYLLERRTNILHGRPVAISRSEVDTQIPTDLMELRPLGRIDNLHNILAMIKLVDFLEKARDLLVSYKRSVGTQRASCLNSLIRLRQDLQQYWHSLPSEIYCRDLSADQPLIRFNVHLALIYHWIIVYIGRTFIFGSAPASILDPNTRTGLRNASRSEGSCRSLVDECVKSALSIVSLCQHLHDHVGLARASWTEFTSCSSALVALMAQQIHSKSTNHFGPCSQGVKLMKQMSVGLYSDTSEKLAIETLELAVRKLNGGTADRVLENTGESGYGSFRNWATQRQGQLDNSDTDQIRRSRVDDLATQEDRSQHNPAEPWSGGDGLQFSDFPFELGDLAELPGLDQWFEFGFH